MCAGKHEQTHSVYYCYLRGVSALKQVWRWKLALRRAGRVKHWTSRRFWTRSWIARFCECEFLPLIWVYFLWSQIALDKDPRTKVHSVFYPFAFSDCLLQLGERERSHWWMQSFRSLESVTVLLSHSSISWSCFSHEAAHLTASSSLTTVTVWLQGKLRRCKYPFHQGASLNTCASCWGWSGTGNSFLDHVVFIHFFVCCSVSFWSLLCAKLISIPTAVPAECHAASPFVISVG